MYYSSGNYEAFATPKKPEGIDGKSAYVVGTGLAGLAAACFLIRDAQMPGEHITLFEHLPVAGGSCDGIYDATKGFIMRGGREMDNHFECMWDLFKSIPSIVNPGETIFSEYYYLNKEDPNFSPVPRHREAGPGRPYRPQVRPDAGRRHAAAQAVHGDQQVPRGQEDR